ncbi:hypothetical protein Rhopal_006614-T1 [Rhodotorula paludigena]|uniref:A-kinase anchor protein 7-like phosphoesterase domain-containing protein n=1 Tax=Rhodotorula paludigena TaxID=86838 RepID=A0AAV5GVR2_9BASI|nr:hypothetical protein Rhopal_006614-T1 [Rhodotorula paludigena]
MPKPTHFLAIPVALPTSSRPHLAKSLPALQQYCKNAGLPQKALRPLGTLHLTLGVLYLAGDDEVNRAKDALRNKLPLDQLFAQAGGVALAGSLGADDADQPLVPPSPAAPIHVSLESLSSMHPPASTSVLYANPVDKTARLQPFAQSVRDWFVQEQLVANEVGREKVVLHATLVNTRYAGRNDGPSRSTVTSSRPSDTIRSTPLTSSGRFDARALLEHFSSTAWAPPFRLEELVLCKMGAKMVLDPTSGRYTGDEEYEVVARRKLPG